MALAECVLPRFLLIRGDLSIVMLPPIHCRVATHYRRLFACQVFLMLNDGRRNMKSVPMGAVHDCVGFASLVFSHPFGFVCDLLAGTIALQIKEMVGNSDKYSS